LESPQPHHLLKHTLCSLSSLTLPITFVFSAHHFHQQRLQQAARFSSVASIKMVHLAKIKTDGEVKKLLEERVEELSLSAPGDDEFSTSVYGSKYAAEDLPSHEMPEREMPKEVAYRMIKDDLSLDGNPMLK
jgi:hypothetical protein